jgi:hypothetical protein
MIAAFPPMPSRSLPVRSVKFHSRPPRTGPPGMEPRGEYAVDGPAAAGQEPSIGGKAEKRSLTNQDIKHRQAGPFGSEGLETRPRREHGGSPGQRPGSRPSIPVNTWGPVDSTRFGGPQDVSLISCRRLRGMAALNNLWGIFTIPAPRCTAARVPRRYV